SRMFMASGLRAAVALKWGEPSSNRHAVCEKTNSWKLHALGVVCERIPRTRMASCQSRALRPPKVAAAQATSRGGAAEWTSTRSGGGGGLALSITAIASRVLRRIHRRIRGLHEGARHRHLCDELPDAEGRGDAGRSAGREARLDAPAGALGEPHRVGAGRLAQDDAESVNALLSCWASVRSSRVAAGRSSVRRSSSVLCTPLPPSSFFGSEGGRANSGELLSGSRGRVNRKVAPLPTWLSAPMRPPWASTIWRQM